MSKEWALHAAPSPRVVFLPRNAHSSRHGAPSLMPKRIDSMPRWKSRRFAIDRLGGGFAAAAAAAASSSTSSSSAAASSSSSSSASSLAAAASAALARSLYPEIINDPFASLLAEAAGPKKKKEEEGKSDDEIDDDEEKKEQEGKTSTTTRPPREAFSAAATAFADATLLYATDLVNLEADAKGSEYRQVVLLGPGLDSRPQRLGWPAGTVLFECASADAHAVAAAALASGRARELAAEAAAAEMEEEEEEEEGEEDEDDDDDEEGGQREGGVFSAFNGSAAPRGRLLRRVVCDVSTEEGREALAERLFEAGFRAERLSAWCVSAGALFDSSSPSSHSSFDDNAEEALGQLFGAVASCAAFCSFVVGDLPPMTRKEAESVVASSGLLGSVVAFGSEGDEAGSALWRLNGWKEEEEEEEEGEGGEEGKEGGEPRRRRWLFVGQQRSQSDAELGILKAFSEAAEDAEGFEDNVS